LGELIARLTKVFAGPPRSLGGRPTESLLHHSLSPLDIAPRARGALEAGLPCSARAGGQQAPGGFRLASRLCNGLGGQTSPSLKSEFGVLLHPNSTRRASFCSTQLGTDSLEVAVPAVARESEAAVTQPQSLLSLGRG